MQSNGKECGSQRPDLTPDQPPEQPQLTAGKKHVDHPMDRPDPDNETEVKLDESAQALIGHHLKAVYSEIVEQPIPDQFLKLLDELERKERER
jgi:Anti-sigma factor NepR